jgi:hypothetical protein
MLLVTRPKYITPNVRSILAITNHRQQLMQEGNGIMSRLTVMPNGMAMGLQGVYTFTSGPFVDDIPHAGNRGLFEFSHSRCSGLPDR